MSFEFVPRLPAILAVFLLAFGPLAQAGGMGWVASSQQSGVTACSGHGQTNFDRCFCDPGWSGPQCADQASPPNCGAHGRASNMRCACEAGWIGKSCEAPCAHGKAKHGACVCEAGWSGAACDAGGPAR